MTMLTTMVKDEEMEQTEQNKITMSGTSYAVIDRYKDMVYRTAYAIVKNFADAEDMMQEVFFKYFQTQPSFESAEHEKAWFLRVTINESRNLLRSAWYRKRADVDIYQIPAPQGEEGGAVLEAVLSLPEKYRTAIYLHYFEGYHIKEIAELTGQRETAVAQHLSRGRKKLEKKLGGLKK